MATLPRSLVQDWWSANRYDVHAALFAAFKRVDDAQQYRRALNLHHLKLYGDHGATGLGGGAYTSTARASAELRYNLIQQCVDTAVAQLGTNRPRSMYLTEGGSYLLQERARKRSTFVDGCFYKHGQYKISRQVLRDGCVFGTGIQKTGASNGRVFTERVFPDEYVIDDIEARYGSPINEFQHREVSRAKLMALYPNKADKIKTASLVRDPFTGVMVLADVVSLIEGVHLGEENDDGEETGRRVLACSTCTLEDEDWGWESPFNKQVWQERPLGTLGRGLGEMLYGTQLELNYLLRKLQAAMTLASSSIWVKRGTNVAQRALTNQPFEVHEYDIDPPTVLNMSPLSAEFFTQFDRLKQNGFEIAGISQMAAAQKKPAGLDSGAALREYNDQQSARFQHVSQSIEEYHVRQGEAYIRAAKRLNDEGTPVKIVARGDGGLETISFDEIDMKPNEYLVRAYPVAFLPSTPAGKLQMAKELGSAFPPLQTYLLGLFADMPDIKAAVELANADTRDADFVINKIISKGVTIVPNNNMNLDVMIKRAQSNILVYEQMDDVPEENLKKLREFMTSCVGARDDLAKQNAPQPAPMPAGPAPAPQPQAPQQAPAPAMAA